MNQRLNSEGRSTEALAWLTSSADAYRMDQLIAPYVDAAAVLSTFSVASLKPARSVKGLTHTEALLELTDRCRIVDSDMWQLEENVRRTALRRLGDRKAIRAARAANPHVPTDPLQEGFDRLIDSDKALALEGLPLEQLLAVERASGWLMGIVEPLPSPQDLAARIERERQFAPMRKIAGQGFVDRENYLTILADYVGALPAESVWRNLYRGIKYVAYHLDERPPLHLYGPGGIGKSALLARFILNHADPRSPQPLPFIYLDFDRSALDPRDPQTILTEAIRQLLIQFPWVDSELLNLGSEAFEQAANQEHADIARSTHFEGRAHLIRRFCRLLSVIAEKNAQPVLMVLDTLEEAEYQGESAMLVTWDLLRELLPKVDRLRIVTAGRSALPPHLPCERVELLELPKDAAQQLVIERAQRSDLSVPVEAARDIASLVGAVPLSLMLAVRVVINEGVNGLRDTVARRSLFSRIKSEQQQGMLYRRILSHVRNHQPELEKVANPGLILRRITPEIIEKVLAGPCELDLHGPSDATRLFNELGREVGLVDAYREPGALWHLPAVRRIMLPDLRGLLGTTTQTIHKAAVDFYRNKANSGAVERAEEIYHRLWLGADATELDKLWQPDLDKHLRGAFEELEPQAKIWLANKLKIELKEELRAKADFSAWEIQAEQRARTLLSNKMVSEALTALTEREYPERPSPLYALQADALQLQGRIEEAKNVVATGLAAAEQAGDRGATLPLLRRAATLYEADGDLTEALSLAMRATQMAQDLREKLDHLSAGITAIRIIRKLEARKEWDIKSILTGDREMDRYRSGVYMDMLKLLDDPSVWNALTSRPALLRETAAELGAQVPDLLVTAISQLGISPEDRIALIRHAENSETKLNEIQRRKLVELKQGPTSRGIGSQAAQLVPAFPAFFANRLMQTVEDSLSQIIDSGTREVLHGSRSELSKVELNNFGNIIAEAFKPEEIEQLALDFFDIRLGHLGPDLSFDAQIQELLGYAKARGLVDKFAVKIARSQPDNQAINDFVRNFSDRNLT